MNPETRHAAARRLRERCSSPTRSSRSSWARRSRRARSSSRPRRARCAILTSEARVAIQRRRAGPAFEIEPHHCFACGTLNEHGSHLDLHLERRAVVGGARPRRSLPGLGRDRPRRDPRDDPRRGHGLGPRRRGQLGADGSPERSSSRRRSTSASRSAPRGGSRGRRTPDRRHRGPPRGSRRTARSWRPRPGSTSRPTRPASASWQARYGVRRLERPGRRREPMRPDTLADGGTSVTPHRRARARGRPERGDRPRRRVRRRPRRRGRTARRGPRRRRSTDPDAFATGLDPGLRAARGPGVRDAQAFVAPGHRPRPRRALAAAGGPSAGLQGGHDAATAHGHAPVRRRSPVPRRVPPRGALVRLRPPRRARSSRDPERTWQLLRRAAREAGDWITVDSLAHPYATGVVAEPYRWAELEQLVFSPSRWERRLVGSTIATMTHGARGKRLGPETAARALPLLEQLIGDAEPDVQKALAWAYRSLAQVDRDERRPPRSRREAELRRRRPTTATARGSSATPSPSSIRTMRPRIRDRLAGIRRRTGAPSTSQAARDRRPLRGAAGPRPPPRTPAVTDPRRSSRP